MFLLDYILTTEYLDEEAPDIKCSAEQRTELRKFALAFGHFKDKFIQTDNVMSTEALQSGKSEEW